MPAGSKGIQVLHFTLITALLMSCVDPIPFPIEDDETNLVIYGNFSQLDQIHEVTIRRTSKFGTVGQSIENASVIIHSSNGTSAPYFAMGEGRYILGIGSMPGVPGDSYKLVVRVGSNEYESSWERMPSPVPIKDVTWGIEFKEVLSSTGNRFNQFLIDVYVDTDLETTTGETAHLRWEVDETYSLMDFVCGFADFAEVCYYEVPKKFDQPKIFNPRNNSVTNLEGYSVFSRLPAPYIQFNELHYFNVTQHSISPSTYEYWDRVSISSNPTGSIFDEIPAAVPGNFFREGSNEVVLGIFEVSYATVDRTLVERFELEKTIRIPKECNNNFPIFLQPDYCCFCWILPNTIQKPDYWGER